MKIFCIGIGGIGLSAVAQILKAQGHQVSGSDMNASAITQRLHDSGISVSEHRADNIDKSTDIVIYSEAISESNPERQQATQLGVMQISYAQSLGMVSEKKQTVAITGTHGKTTVTGMLTSIFLEAKLDPSIVIGSKIDLLDHQNFRVGSSPVFLTEACEYRGNFLFLKPHIVLINNLEPDHLDYFKTDEAYYACFQELCEKIPSDGKLILWEEDQQYLDLDTISAEKLILTKTQAFELQVPGQHNQMNATAAAAVAKALGVDEQSIVNGLKNFKGTWRRFEYKGSVNGAKVYDDYGHHPTEIAATLQAAREWYPEKQIHLIFQPHQYSRTRHFFDDFTSAFGDADEVWISDIYQARDSKDDLNAVSAEKLVEAIDHESVHYKERSKIAEEIQSNVSGDKVILFMGAGNISQLISELRFDR